MTLTSEMHFVKFHPEVASCLISRGKRKYAPLGMRLLWKYIRNYFLVYHLISHFLLYLQNYKEFEAEIFDLQSEKYGLSFDIKNILLPVEPWGMRMWSAYPLMFYLNINDKWMFCIFWGNPWLSQPSQFHNHIPLYKVIRQNWIKTS